VNPTALTFIPIAIFVTSLAISARADSVEVSPAGDRAPDQTSKKSDHDEKPDPERERRYKNNKYRHDDDAGKPPKFSNPSTHDDSAQPISGRK
jgi:hypothetical protein